MTRFFKKLPLQFKLLLLVLTPTVIFIVLGIRIYKDHSDKADSLYDYVKHIRLFSEISSIGNQLQMESRRSYFYSLKKDAATYEALLKARPVTDSLLQALDRNPAYHVLRYRDYTFLDRLKEMRSKIDSGASPDEIIHYFTTAIFRIKTISHAFAVSNELIDPIYKDVVSARIMGDIFMYLGIFRSNFYNALYHGRNDTMMLYGLWGPYEVYKSYERELYIKSPPEVIRRYEDWKSLPESRRSLEYIDRVFTKFSFDTLWSPEDWWANSAATNDSLIHLQKDLLIHSEREMESSFRKEDLRMDLNLVFMIIAAVVVLSIMYLATRLINQMLLELDHSAQRIARGEEAPAIGTIPDDVMGRLAHSIEKIGKSNKKLAEAATSIGHGDFNVDIKPRGSNDALGIAIIAMKKDLQEYMQKVEKSKDEFKQIANDAPVMIWMTDESGRCVFVNEGWLKFTGRQLEDELGEGWRAGLHPDDTAHCQVTFNNALTQRSEFQLQYRLKNKDGSFHWLSESCSPRFSPSGKFEGFIGTCFDINEIREHERRKDDFIVMASHELKTPITSIKGYIQLLFALFHEYERTRQLPSEDSVRSSLMIIEKQVNKLTRLLSDLLDFSKIEREKLELEKKRFNLNELVGEAIDEVRLTAANREIRFIREKEFEILADRDRIGQVLLNLLTNAIKYSRPPHPVVVQIFEPRPGEVTVSVRDEGIGIPVKEQSRIFERFYRVEGKNEQTYPGFGIGLYIASEIISRHHGKLDVKSEKGRGSTFSFTLPTTILEKQTVKDHL